VRVLLDQGVPRRAAALLREAGVDALHVDDLGMSSVVEIAPPAKTALHIERLL
jgi:predicted nuclease of predicted toxin-antitoxin system